ncbi:MAG: hypothetical protein KF774_03580 [Planctomyces sp.]|nr:hypothetical protein [Planctomyces sp.]
MRSALPIGMLWAILLGASLLRVPVPGVNEPHYLTRARAFWDPAWCPGDLFLESAPAHRAFYLAIGWLTRILPFDQAAIVGRFAGLAVLAWGWWRLCDALAFGAARAAAALSVLLLLQTLGSWSGEWIVGGIESKVFAYGLGFAGLGAWLSRREPAAGLWLGLATTAHPLVGGWMMAAVGLAELGRRRWMPEFAPEQSTRRRLIALSLWWFVAAAPGIVWAMSAIRSPDALTSLQADFIQVSYRLAHHLDAWTFPRESHRWFACLCALWLLLRHASGSRSLLRRIDVVAGCSLAVSLGIVLATAGPRPLRMPLSAVEEWQVRLLKFYGFRMADALIPVALSLHAAEFWYGLVRAHRPRWALLPVLGAYAIAVAAPGPDQNPSRMTPDVRRDWRAAMHWIRERSAEGALIQAANENWGVKWYAERPEYVNFKDCPQDAAGIVEWNRRLSRFTSWSRAGLADDGRVSAADLERLRDETGIEFLISSRFGPIDVEPVYANATFRVHRTAPGAETDASSQSRSR